jgi:nicotinic acetylcholine receptor
LICFFLDKQECDLRFGSWTYDQRQMNFSYYNEEERNVTIKDYVVSGSWDLLRGPMSIIPSTLTSSTNNATDSSNSTASIMSTRLEKADTRDRVEFVCTLTIKRKTLFYTVNLIIPTVNSYLAQLKII